MKKWIGVFLGISVFLMGCAGEKRDSADDIKKEFMATLDEELEGGSLTQYIDGDIELVDAPSHFPEGGSNSLLFYEFQLEANLTSEFQNLTDDEKYNLFKELDTAYLDGNCGKEMNSHCNIDTFTFSSGSDKFVVSPSYGFEIALNDENFDPAPAPVLTDETDTDSSGVDREAVYSFMKSAYDQVTNYGDTYDPETHDPMVAKMAAEKFGISESEAGQIYVDMETSGY